MLNILSGKIYPMETATAKQTREGGTRQGPLAERTWRERSYSLSLQPQGEDLGNLRRLASSLWPDTGWRMEASPTPDIPIATFRGREAMEETLVRWIQRICRPHPGFSLTVCDPVVFPDLSLRMKVRDVDSLERIIQALGVLETYIRSCGTGPVEWVRTPYSRLGKATPPHGAGRSASGLGEYGMEAEFPVHRLVLERRMNGEEGSEVVCICPLQPRRNQG